MRKRRSRSTTGASGQGPTKQHLRVVGGPGYYSLAVDLERPELVLNGFEEEWSPEQLEELRLSLRLQQMPAT